MTITAKIVADSVVSNTRITTLELCYPRFIHSEFMTHRMFSRNASSSRAIPVEKMIDSVKNNPAIPIHWGKNQAGMQAREELTQKDLEEATERCIIEEEQKPGYDQEFPNWWYAFTESHEGLDEVEVGYFQTEPLSIKEVLYREWVGMARETAKFAEELNRLGLHKQIVNRVLEPFQHIKVIVTATEWENFFKLRLHEDAQPEMYELARVMLSALQASKPNELNLGEWHLPYINWEDIERWWFSSKCPDNLSLFGLAIKLSVARCARVSYLNHDNSFPDIDKDIDLADKLLEAGHMSCFEHQATPMHGKSGSESPYYTWVDGVTHVDRYGEFWSNNFKGWIQYRAMLND